MVEITGEAAEGVERWMAKQCELCDLPARMFCESDQASLCWECDAKVHGANFLVARHCRLLLCRSCQAPTPWRASGSRLGSTVSVCSKCLGDNTAEGRDCCETARGVGGGGGEAGERVRRGESMERLTEGSRDTEVEEEDSEGEDEDEDDEEYEEEAEDGDNQVVPWSTEAEATATASPPPAASCSSNDDSSSSRAAFYYGLMKRRREEDDLLSHHVRKTKRHLSIF